MQEVERTYARKLNSEEVISAISQAVSQEYELAIDTIVLLKPGSIPKTSSGKIQRSVCRQKFIDGTIENVIFKRSMNQISKERKKIEFSLLYFSSNEAEFTDNKYKLLLEGAKFADKNNFHAVWIPERHFHSFGGLYPQPAVLASALAMVTENIRIRPGSVVLPLQNPVRVAEQWSVVDNLSGGRVDISFARGWNPNDFVLAPENYTDRTQIMFDGIKTVQKLWRGESINLPNGTGEDTEIKIYPLPKQTDLPTWITCSGGKERFIEAGAIGANILTALLFQPIEELAEKIKLYRESRAKNSYDPNTGHVTLMLHTFVSDDLEFVRSQVRQPFIEYLESSIDLWRNNSQDLDQLTSTERQHLLAYAFERYFHTTALFGTPSSCLNMVNELKEIGVNEIACLIDFGVDANSVLSNLVYLNQLRQIANASQIGNEINYNRINSTVINQEINHQREQEFVVNRLEKLVAECISFSLQTELDKISLNSNFVHLGIDSLKASEIIGNLEEILKISISPALMFEYSTINELSSYLVKSHKIKLEHDILVCQYEDIESIESGDKYTIDSKIKSEKYYQSNQSNTIENQRVTGEL